MKRDEPIFEISTDKVDAEIPAPSSGTLAEIIVIEGQTVPVSTVVARLETEVGAAVAAPASAPTKSEPAKAVAAPSAPGKAAAASAPVAPPRTESTRPSAEPTGTRPRTVGSGNGNSLEDRLRTKSSPLVRRRCNCPSC